MKHLLVLVSILVGFNALALDTQNIQFKTIRAAHQSAFQSGASFFSGAVVWTPDYQLSEDLRLGVDLGASLLRLVDQSVFIAPEYLAKAKHQVAQNIFAELGVGAQTWIRNGGTVLKTQANGSYVFTERMFNYLDHVFVGYDLAKTSPSVTHTVRVGAGFAF